MTFSKPTFSSYEHFLCEFDQGFKLVNPRSHLPEEQRLQTVLNQSFNIYLINKHFAFDQINQCCIQTCGFDSEKAALGKIAADFADEESSRIAVHTDQEVMLQNRLKLFDQDLVRKDGKLFQFLTIKAPLYNEMNQIIGLLGCSIDISLHSLAASLESIINLGLFHKQFKIKNEALNGTYLSKQQRAIANLLLTGLSAKKIAKHLQLSSRTVEAYIQNMKDKMQCQNKIELILKLSKLFRENAHPSF